MFLQWLIFLKYGKMEWQKVAQKIIFIFYDRKCVVFNVRDRQRRTNWFLLKKCGIVKEKKTDENIGEKLGNIAANFFKYWKIILGKKLWIIQIIKTILNFVLLHLEILLNSYDWWGDCKKKCLKNWLSIQVLWIVKKQGRKLRVSAKLDGNIIKWKIRAVFWTVPSYSRLRWHRWRKLDSKHIFILFSFGQRMKREGIVLWTWSRLWAKITNVCKRKVRTSGKKPKIGLVKTLFFLLNSVPKETVFEPK